MSQIIIRNEDFLTASIEKESVDLIVTSPPYNIGMDYDQHKDQTPYDIYKEFSLEWLTKGYEAVKTTGRLCVNVSLDTNKGGNQSLAADITTWAKEVGWKYHTTIIWNEGNMSRRTAWGSWKSASAPYIIAPVEVIIVCYKDKWKKATRGESDVTREEFIEWTNGLWKFNGESAKRIGHPAPFPRELPKRCIKMFSYIGDTVLDPFLGSGTTLIEAKTNNRSGIGFEISKEYCELSQKRIDNG